MSSLLTTLLEKVLRHEDLTADGPYLALRWHGRRMAWLAVWALLTVIIAFWGTSLFGGTQHSLDDLKLRTPEATTGAPN